MREFFTSRFTTIKAFIETQEIPKGDLKNLFSWEYWSQDTSPAASPYYVATAILILLTLISLVLWRRSFQKKHMSAPVYEWPINQLANLVFFILLMSVSYYFFKAQQIQYLSSPLIPLVTVTASVGWISWVAFYLWRIVPTKRDAHLEKERFFRYLPKVKERNR